MSKVDSHLSLMARKSVAAVEKGFSRLSKQHCPDREEGFCERTGRRCELESCPKMREQIREYL